MVSGTSDSAEAYGDLATDLLRQIEEPVICLAHQFAVNFYETLASSTQNQRVLSWLSTEEYAQLQRRQAQHLILLLAPNLSAEQHRTESERAGRAHALVGVDSLWLVETYSVYQQRLFELLDELVPDGAVREDLLRIVSCRILLDLQGQLAGYERFDRDVSQAFLRIDQHVLAAANLPDLVRGAMAAIQSMESGIELFFARADAQGILQIEASAGAAAERYHQAMEDRKIPKISIDKDLPSGRGTGGMAWRSGEIHVSDAWLLEEKSLPWRSVGKELGFRSSAAIPLLDDAGNSIALLSLYSRWPGHFSTNRVRNFLIHVQRVLGHAIQRMNNAAVIPLREQQDYRRLLEAGHLTMLYQPIVDLHDGRLCRLEALARLRGEDGALISPGRFLPSFGESELLTLFEEGLAQICEDARLMDGEGLSPGFSLNLPAGGLGDLRYEQAIFAILEATGFSPSRLQLEVLETEDSNGQTEQVQAFLRRLRERGVRFAQDDLGSGHSSLLRMGRYTFDEVKIDQGLVRSVIDKPQRALEFIVYLTRLAHAFHTQVVVEGLEHMGMIEAAAILGADHGQGYAIARPMPAREVAAWQANYRYPVNLANPKTALGTMAGYLLWDMQMKTMADCFEAAQELPVSNRIVERYVAANRLEASPLGNLLIQIRRAEGTTVDQHEERNTVIEHLAEYWLDEMGR